MQQIILTPTKTWTSSGSSFNYVDYENMFNSATSTTTATVYCQNSNLNTYNLDLGGFDFSKIPANATIINYELVIKLGVVNLDTNVDLVIYDHNDSYEYDDPATGQLSSTLSYFTFSPQDYSLPSWQYIQGMGEDLSIRIPLKRTTTSAISAAFITGASFIVNYISDQYEITSTLSGDGTIKPFGISYVDKNDTYSLTITPTDDSETVVVTNNDVDVSSLLIRHSSSGSGTAQENLGTYTLISGEFSGSGATYFSGLTGKGYDAANVNNNYYGSAIFQYTIPITIPDGVTITSLYMMVKGKPESTGSSSEYMCVQLKSGNIELSEEYNFKNSGTTSVTTQTIYATTIPTAEQLANLVIECKIGYWGGSISGATVFCEYSAPAGDYYTYDYTPTENAIIAVNIFTPSQTTVTSSIIGGGIISPSGSTSIQTGQTYTLTITPTDLSKNVGVIKNNIDVSRNLTPHYTGGVLDYYTYSYTVVSQDNIVVNIFLNQMYMKIAGEWRQASKVYKKINGNWVEQTNLSNLFDSRPLIYKS